MKQSYTKAWHAARKILLSLALVLAGMTLLAQATVYVKTDGSPWQPGDQISDHNTWATATNDLQFAMNVVSNDGGVIWVAKGTYVPTSYLPINTGMDREKAFLMQNGVTVIGGFAGTETDAEDRSDFGPGGANETILSGDHGSSVFSYHVVYAGASVDETAILKDLTITNGKANMAGSDEPYTSMGGGAFLAGGVLESCALIANEAIDGGGACTYEGGALINCQVLNNQATSRGGGVYMHEGGEILKNTRIAGNTAVSGGGVYALGVNPSTTEFGTINASAIQDNQATGMGGGLYLDNNGEVFNSLITNNESTGNGGGVYLTSGGRIANSTVCNNESAGMGKGLYLNGAATFVNGILWGNAGAGAGDQADLNGMGNTFTHNGIENGGGSFGNLNLNSDNTNIAGPHFILPTTFSGNSSNQTEEDAIRDSDWAIELPSSCIDAGTTVTGLPSTDYNEGPRILKGIVDMGAVEANYFEITISKTGNGTVSPESPGEPYGIMAGADQKFTLTPESGLEVIAFTIDGNDAMSQLVDEGGNVRSYTFSDIWADYSMAVTFGTATYYTITITKSDNGTVDPYNSGDPVQVLEGEDQKFTLTPESGYEVTAFTVDGNDAMSQLADEGGEVRSYTFTNVQANHTMSVTFAAQTYYTITITKSDNGTVDPFNSGDPVQVLEGEDQKFTLTPDNGYEVSEFKVDDADALGDLTDEGGEVRSYTFSDVQANHTMTVTFESTTGLRDEALSEVSIYPNPVGDMLHIRGIDQGRITLTNITGVRVATYLLEESGNEIPVNHLASGIYFGRIESGEATKTIKILKE